MSIFVVLRLPMGRNLYFVSTFIYIWSSRTIFFFWQYWPLVCLLCKIKIFLDVDSLGKLRTKKGKVDTLVLTESKLDFSFPTNRFFIKGSSNPFRFERNKNRGSIRLYIKEDIPCRELKLHRCLCNIERIFLEVNLRKTKWLLFATYHPPSQVDKCFFGDVGKSLDKYSHIHSKFNAEEP